MEATLKYVDKMTFLGRGASNHWVTLDTTALDGVGAGPSPMELLLMSVAGCSAMDVVAILRKKRVQFDSLEIKVSGERVDTHPKRFRRIQLEYVFTGTDLPRKALEDAVRLSQEKYCSVAATINESTELTYTVTILPADKEEKESER